MKDVVKRTISLYFLILFVGRFGFSFFFATYTLFLMSRGLNLFQANLVNLCFYVTLFICEIPTGAFADVFGRKLSYVFSCFIFSASLFMYAVSNSFWDCVLAECVGAFGATFATGAFQAWLVDHLKHQGFSGSFDRIFALEEQVVGSAGIFGAFIGATLANRNISLPWVCAGISMLAAGIMAATFMKEEYFVRQKFSFVDGLSSMGSAVQASWRYGLKNKVVRFILLAGTMQSFAVMAANMQWQPLFAKFLSTKTGLGLVFDGIAISTMIGAAASPWFLGKLKNEKRAILFSQIIIGAGMLLTVSLGKFSFAISAFLLHEIGRGLFKPLKSAYLNKNIPSKERATLLSFEALAHHVGGAIGLLLSGFVAEYVSIKAAWILSGGVLIIASIILARNNHK